MSPAPSPRRHERRHRDPLPRLGAGGGAAAALAVALATTLAPPAAGFAGPDELPEPTPELLAASVIAWDPARTVIQWDPAGTVRSVEQVETEAGRTTITLAADILFTPDSADLPQTAAARIGELVAQVPQGAAVQVHGHTDSVQGAVDNQQLSTARAEAVADVLRAGRPDLQLEVAGFAAARPAVAERPDDPSTRAANRRVEIVYAG